MSSSPFASLRRHCCFTSVQLAENHFGHAKQLVSTGNRKDAEGALAFLDAALELHPKWEKALELKARILLYLKRFREVVEFLHEFLPGANQAVEAVDSLCRCPSRAEETSSDDARGHNSLARLRRKVSSGMMLPGSKKAQPLCDEGSPKAWEQSSILKLCQKLSSRPCKGDLANKLGWRYLILGQACCHLGMMEDAMLLLQSGKRTMSAASRRLSNTMRDDNFCSGSSIETTNAAEFDLINHMLSNIKLLLRRRVAAEAALEAGLYDESVRHFTKIIDNSKSAPPGFIEDCYLHRAIVYQATGRVVDAIADCNHALALNPRCTEALSVRASLHEMVKNFSECLLDLQQLKMMYEALLRCQQASVDWTASGRPSGRQDLSKIAIQGSLEYINTKIMATRRGLSSRTCSLAARTILDVPQDCSMEDVEKAYLLLSLKHSLDKAAHFVENCAYQDGSRDVETVKEEARASALRLSQLIHKAYTKLLSVISEEKAEEQTERRACEAAFRRQSRNKSSYKLPDSSEEDCLESPCRSECFNRGRDAQAESEGYFEEGDELFNGVHNRISVCNVVEPLREASNDIARIVDTGCKLDAGVGERCHNSEERSIDASELVCSDTMVAEYEVMDSLSDVNIEEEEKATGVCFEGEVCKEAGDNNEAVRVIMKALSGFKHGKDAGMKLAKGAIDAEPTDQPDNDELDHLRSSCHGGGLCTDSFTNAISQTFAFDNANLMAHQHWVMNISDSHVWNLPLSQPLSVT